MHCSTARIGLKARRQSIDQLKQLPIGCRCQSRRRRDNVIKVFCDRCGKEIDTTVFYERPKNKLVEKLMQIEHICMKCAKEIAETVEG